MFESNTQMKALKAARLTSGTSILANDLKFSSVCTLITTCCKQYVVQRMILLPLQLRWMEFACVVLSNVSVFYGVHWRAVSTLCIVSGKIFATSPGTEILDLATAVEGLTLSLAIQQTTRFTSTLSSMISFCWYW